MDDLISRQAAIDSMCELMRHWFGCDSKDEIREIKRELGKLPSVQPEPKTVRDTLNSMTDDEFADWLCHQIFPDYAEDNADNILRYKSVMNFLKMDIKQAKEEE